VLGAFCPGRGQKGAMQKRGKTKHPDAEGAEVTQKAQKNPSKDFLLRLLRSFCAFCVRILVF
jgi:hypothetical protein